MTTKMLPPMTLRALRLWHWRKVLSYRAVAARHAAYADDWERRHPGKVCRYSRGKERQMNQRANWHLGPVQVLNDVVTGTAEQDALAEDQANA